MKQIVRAVGHNHKVYIGYFSELRDPGKSCITLPTGKQLTCKPGILIPFSLLFLYCLVLSTLLAAAPAVSALVFASVVTARFLS